MQHTGDVGRGQYHCKPDGHDDNTRMFMMFMMIMMIMMMVTKIIFPLFSGVVGRAAFDDDDNDVHNDDHDHDDGDELQCNSNVLSVR